MDYTFESDNNNAATVTSSGKVTATGIGTANISVKTKNGIEVAKIPVSTIPSSGTVRPSSITLNKRDLTIFSNASSERLEATVSPSNATNRVVYWEAANPNLVSLEIRDNVCRVRANEGPDWGKSEGTKTTTVTARTSNGLTASCDVTIRVQGTFVDSLEIIGADTKNGKVLIDYEGSLKQRTVDSGTQTYSFIIKCNYHNVGSSFINIETDFPTEDDMTNLSRYGSFTDSGSEYEVQHGPIKAGATYYIPVCVARNRFAERELTIKVRGNGSGDSWKTVTVLQEANETMQINRYPDKMMYFAAAGGRAQSSGHTIGTFSTANVTYHIIPSASKNIDGQIKVTVNNITENLSIGKASNSTAGWVYLNNITPYLTTSSGRRMTDTEWNAAIANAGPKDLLFVEGAIICAKNTTTSVRTAVITLPEGQQINVTQSAATE